MRLANVQNSHNCLDCYKSNKEYPQCFKKNGSLNIKNPSPAEFNSETAYWEYAKKRTAIDKEIKTEYGLFILDGICPLPFVDWEIGEVVRMVNVCKNHSVLPFSGSYTEQPLWYIDALGIINRIESEIIENARSTT